MQNDVTRRDLELAVRENLRSIEHVKRYTTCGMAVDQGKTSNMNALGLLADLLESDISELGTTTFRPPYDPVTLGALAARRLGSFHRALRRTPLDRWHQEHAAVLEEFAGWRRPAWYARHGDSHEVCVRKEKRAARCAVSLFDASPLGKIEVRGADAGIFLNRMYYNNMRSLAPGHVRYGVMLNEHGTVIDDGVCVRLAENHFLVSTTSGGVGRIFAGFEELLQCEWPDLKVLVTNVTSQWGNVTIAGPKARQLLLRLDSDIDLSRDAFPHMTAQGGHMEGVPVRVVRVGFTGEMSYEVNIPAGYMPALWEFLIEKGDDLGIAPLGLEALQELRTEKGFIHIGTDTDAQTIPADLGMGTVLERKTEDFIGRRSLTRPNAKRAERLHFVGIAADDPAVILPVGAHVVADPKRPSDSQGYVTSSCASEALGRGVALGLVRCGRGRLGETAYVYSQGEIWPAQLVSTAWYDPHGTRTAM
jgi:sarcosine oxidase subunit alpha